MRALLQPEVMRAAGLATVASLAACLPRLSAWPQRPHTLWFVALVLAWGAFILWSFVFAWIPRHGRGKVFVARPEARWVALATVAGLAATLLLRRFVDPILSRMAPADYPANGPAWLAMLLFSLGFSQLFLYFGPVSVCLRLFRREDVALALTMLLGALVAWLRSQTAETTWAPGFLACVIGWRMVAGLLAAWLFLRGGVGLASWWLLLVHLRHWPGLHPWAEPASGGSPA